MNIHPRVDHSSKDNYIVCINEGFGIEEVLVNIPPIG